LSYTESKCINLALSSDRLRDKMEISADVNNSGGRAGSEVVQLYVRDLIGSLTRPVRELKGFQRVTLQPGETRRVTFCLREEDLAFTRADGTLGVEPGGIHVWVAPNSHSGLRGEFRVEARATHPCSLSI
jgi:beta-glucosidase